MAAPISHRSRLTLTPRAVRSALGVRAVAGPVRASAIAASAAIDGMDAVQASEAAAGTPSRKPQDDTALYRPPPRAESAAVADGVQSTVDEPTAREAVRRYGSVTTTRAGISRKA